MAGKTGKSYDDLERLEQLQLRATVATEEQVDVLKRIAVAIEQQNAQNGPGYVLVEGGPLTARTHKTVREALLEQKLEREAHSQLARFADVLSNVLEEHLNCLHDDRSLWLAVAVAGEDVLGPGWWGKKTD